MNCTIFMHYENYIRDLTDLGNDIFENMDCIFPQVFWLLSFHLTQHTQAGFFLHKILGSFIHMYPIQQHKSSIIAFGITPLTPNSFKSRFCSYPAKAQSKNKCLLLSISFPSKNFCFTAFFLTNLFRPCIMS